MPGRSRCGMKQGGRCPRRQGGRRPGEEGSLGSSLGPPGRLSGLQGRAQSRLPDVLPPLPEEGRAWPGRVRGEARPGPGKRQGRGPRAPPSVAEGTATRTPDTLASRVIFLQNRCRTNRPERDFILGMKILSRP